jgi:hypothetical protein
MVKIKMLFINFARYFPKIKYSSLIIILISFSTLVIVIFGYAVTAPIRGEIMFGANFMSNDGVHYAAKALEISGYSKQSACAETENLWSKWQGSEYDWCPSSGLYVPSTYYSSRLLYPLALAILIPIVGIYSVVWIPIIVLFIMFIYHVKFLLKLKLSVIASILSITTLLSSKHFIELSLSTALTDLILSVFVFFLFYYIFLDKSYKFLIVLTLLISILSTINKQSQVFWIAFSLVAIFLTHFTKIKLKRKINLVSIILISTQIFSLYATDQIWGSISTVRNTELGLIFTEIRDFDDLFIIIIELLKNDLATILTKNLGTLFIFLSYAFLICSILNKKIKSEEIDKIQYFGIFLTACLCACLINAIIIGLGNINLRMYLPFISCSLISVAYTFEKIITLKSQERIEKN